MARYTTSPVEAKHLAKIIRESPVYGIVKVRMLNGSEIEGLVRFTQTGNSFGKSSPVEFYGELHLQTLNGKMIAVDYLDVESIVDVWNTRSHMYVEQGLIVEVDSPFV